MKYDVFVENPSAFINQFLNSLHVSLPIKVENKLIKLAKLPHNKKSKNFNFKSHFRSGKNRQFEHELDRSTLKELNIILKDILDYWNFEYDLLYFINRKIYRSFKSCQNKRIIYN